MFMSKTQKKTKQETLKIIKNKNTSSFDSRLANQTKSVNLYHSINKEKICQNLSSIYINSVTYTHFIHIHSHCT